MKQYKLEKEYQRDITKQLKEKGAFVFKIPDVGLGYKPFDFIAAFRYNSYYVEVKLAKKEKYKWNPHNRIEPHQLTSLLLAHVNCPESRCEVWLWWNTIGEFHFPIVNLVEYMKTHKSIDWREDFAKMFKV